MRVLTLTGTRNFDVVLRSYASSDDYEVILTNENYGTTSTIAITKTQAQIIANTNQLEVPVTDDYNEGDEYEYKIIESGATEILHRGKLFFTAQTPQDYNING